MGDKEELNRFMLASHNWAAIEGMHDELFAASILTELPIAINVAGGSVRSISVSCFPQLTNHSRLFANETNEKRGQTLAALTRSCNQLETFHFGHQGMNHSRIRRHHLPTDEQACMDEYLGAMLSSKDLVDVHLNMYSFALNDGTGTLGPFIRIGSALSSIQSCRLRRVGVSSVSLQGDELRTLISALGSQVQHVALSGVEIVSGSWADLLDLLRSKVAAQCQDGRCTASLDDLFGGEFQISSSHLDSPASMTSQVSDSGSAGSRKSALVNEAQEYISGKLLENPLRGSMQKWT
jgi:hypothetical protein